MASSKSGLPSAVRTYLPFAEGGLVCGPTHALVGEAGPEVIIPLTKPKRARQLAAQSGLMEMLGMDGASAPAGGGGVTIAPVFNLADVGNAEATAARVMHRLALTYAM